MLAKHEYGSDLLDFEQLSDLESRKKLAKMLIKLFNHWHLDSESRLKLLGFSANSRAVLSKLASGEKGIGNNTDALDRAGYLLAMHKALRLLYPHNEKTRYQWVNLRNKAFDNYTPLEVMLEEGLIGLARVSRYLDFIRGQ